MTAEHPDSDVVTGGHHAAQQMIFTVTQLVENVARMRQATDARRADAARAEQARLRDAQRAEESRQRAAAADERAAAGAARDAQRVAESQQRSVARDAEAQARAAERVAATEQRAAATAQRETAAAAATRQRTDRAAYTTAAAPKWRREAAPADLLTAWAAATTWAAHDTKAADVMVRTEDEMRARWPQVLERYDRLRIEDGLHPAAAMKITLTHALNAGWDPAGNPAAHPRGGRAPQAALSAGTTEQVTTEQAATADAAPPAAAAGEQAAPEQTAPELVTAEQAAPAPTPAHRPATNPAEQALRWMPTATAALANTHAPRHRTDGHPAAPARVPAPTLER